jgi:mono/diheme cytochrome c family protein
LRRSRGSDLSLQFVLRVVGAGGQTAHTGGGSFANPLSLDAISVLILIATGCLAITLVVGGAPRPGLPAGYLGDLIGAAADRVSIGRIRPVWSLGLLVFIGVAMGLVLGSHFDGKPLSKQQASQGNPVKSSPESIARGGMLFSQNCTMCHGESGRGDGPVASSLRIPPANLYDHVPYHPDQFFFGVITNGLGGVMPSFKASIGDDDRWNILNYLRDRFGEAPAVQ